MMNNNKTTTNPTKQQSNWKKYLSVGIWVFIGVVLAGFFLRVLFWENAYYSEKEGSERNAPAISVSNSYENLDETEITEQETIEYTVAWDRPRYLTIERLGVQKARVLPMDLKASGELSAPASIFDAGWYIKTAKPGFGGVLLLDGHNGGPTKSGIFKNLPDLTNGDIIKIERGDGKILSYQVTKNTAIELTEATAYMNGLLKSDPAQETVVIISCTGDWSQTQRTYLSRQFTEAILISEE